MEWRVAFFSAEAAVVYSKAIGRELRVEEIQPVTNDLLAVNFIMRHGHGIYRIADPFVQEFWRERQIILGKGQKHRLCRWFEMLI